MKRDERHDNAINTLTNDNATNDDIARALCILIEYYFDRDDIMYAIQSIDTSCDIVNENHIDELLQLIDEIND